MGEDTRLEIMIIIIKKRKHSHMRVQNYAAFIAKGSENGKKKKNDFNSSTQRRGVRFRSISL